MNSKHDLPQLIRKAAIQFAKRVTGIGRPVKEHRVHIDAFEECFDFMVRNGMVKEEFINERKDENKTVL